MPAARYSEELLGGYGCTGWLPGGQQAMSERGGPDWPANHRTAVTPRSTHRCTQPFTLFGAVWRFAAALWRRLGAPLGLPSSAGCASRWYHCHPVRHLLCWPHRLSSRSSDGSAPAGVMAEPARLSALSASHSASGLPSLRAGGECMQAAPASGAPRSRRTSLLLLCTPYPWSAPDRRTSHWTFRVI